MLMTMKVFVSLLLLLLCHSFAIGQFSAEVDSLGELAVTVLEPSHTLWVHPSLFQPPARDTSRFSQYTFAYLSHDFVFHPLNLFPSVGWNTDYSIIDSSRNQVTYSFWHYVAQWHLGPRDSYRYLIDARYDRHGRLSSTRLIPDFVTPSNGEASYWAGIRKKVSYHFGDHGLINSSNGISFDRNDAGQLRFFRCGHTQLSNAAIFDLLDQGMTDGVRNDLRYELDHFMGTKYEGPLLKAYIHLSREGAANKVSLDYDSLGRVRAIVDFPEDEKQAHAKIEIAYVGDSPKVLRIIKRDFATNWDYSITQQQIWEYQYAGDRVSELTIIKWDSHRWDNAFYDNMENGVREVIGF